MTLYSSKFTQFWLVLMQYYFFKPGLCRCTLFFNSPYLPFCFHVAYFIQKYPKTVEYCGESNNKPCPLFPQMGWIQIDPRHGLECLEHLYPLGVVIENHHFCSLNHRFPSFLLVNLQIFPFFHGRIPICHHFCTIQTWLTHVKAPFLLFSRHFSPSVLVVHDARP